MAIFSTQAVITGLQNPTSLQFGPDGRLYVSQQDGLILVYDIAQPNPGEWQATLSETITLVRDIPNHDDDGTRNLAITTRQVTGVLVGGTAENPVLYVTSSDPRIAEFVDSNLDTNSGILSELTWNGTSWDKVDLIRGLPRSEENHSANGMAFSADGTKLYLTPGGNTNNGAPSTYFANLSEYALGASMLEVDLVALAAMPVQVFDHGGGVTSQYKYDLPTLDDPTRANDGAPGGETADGMDVSGPFGGNDGLNQAVLPADAPMRLFATGLRNAYDVVVTQAGYIFTIDNGSNDGLGGIPLLDGEGNATNTVNNGGIGNPDTLRLVVDGGYYGHANPIRSNPHAAVVAYGDGEVPPVIAELADPAAAVPAGVAMTPGYLVDPSRFTADPARLALEGQGGAGPAPLAAFLASTNGLMEYTADAFEGEITGDLVTVSFDGTIKLIDMAADGVSVLGVTTLATPGGVPLDLTQGPDGTIWVAQIGSGQVLALSPSDGPVATNPDTDGDGLLNTVDPFQTDAGNGAGVLVAANSTLAWSFQFGSGSQAPGPAGLFLGLTGHMTNGTRDFTAPVEEGGVDLTNVKIGTAAGGGLVVLESVSNGTADGASNTGEYLFQTGVTIAPNVSAFHIRWTALNPYPGLATIHQGQQIGGMIGTGDQDNYLKLAAGPDLGGEVHFLLESGGVTVASESIAAAELLAAPAGSMLRFDLAVDRAGGMAVPSVTYEGVAGPVTVTGAAIDLAGTAILAAIEGTYAVEGVPSGLAVGLWSTNAGEGSEVSFQAAFDGIEITSEGGLETLVKAVNLGGAAFTSSAGIAFEADPGVSTGTGLIHIGGDDIAGTDDVLYNSERWAPGGGSYGYEVPVANGHYRVELHLAEIYNGITAAGQRVFDMQLEGQALAPLQDIDIFGRVGPDTPLVINQVVEVTDGALSIQVGPGSFAPGNVENAKLNGFAVFAVDPEAQPTVLSIAATDAARAEGDAGVTAFTFAVTRAGNVSQAGSVNWAVAGGEADAADFVGGVLPGGVIDFAAGETDAIVMVEVAGDTALETDEAFTVTLSGATGGALIDTGSAGGLIVNDDAAGLEVLVKAVNLGGGAYVAANGVAFEADAGPSSGTSFVYGADDEITGTEDDTLYNSERWAPGGSYVYDVPVANGLYRVELHLAEIFDGITVAGQRVFDMSLEGQALAALQDIDVFAAVGADAALVIEQLVQVDDGVLSIQVGPGSDGPGNAENAKLNGFAVFAVDPVQPTMLSVAALDAVKAEGDAGATAFTFAVTRSGDVSQAGSVAWTAGGADVDAADFAGGAMPGGVVDFAAGESEATVTVEVAGDTVLEADEAFAVTLSDASGGAVIGTASAAGRILNDDAAGLEVLVKAVNLGGGAFTSSAGIAFEADAGPTTGASFVHFGGDDIVGSTDDVLYNSERYAPGGSYVYDVPVANGLYRVELHLAEIYNGITAAGQRVFDMSLEGQALAALQDIDVFAAVGADAPLVIEQLVQVNDGALSIRVGPGASAPGNAENAKLNAFAVFAVDPAGPATEISVAAVDAVKAEGDAGATAFTFAVTRSGDVSQAGSVSWAVAGGTADAADFVGGVLPGGVVDFAAGETEALVTVEVAGDTTVETDETFTVTLSDASGEASIAAGSAAGAIVNDDVPGLEVLVKAVNLGGAAYVAANGVAFEADAGPSSGTSFVYGADDEITGTEDDTLYNSERWAPGGSYVYDVPVANGLYRVELHLAEIFDGITVAGQRVFDMSLEGQALAALQDIDVFAAVGADAALVIEQLVQVDDGVLSIQVGPGSDGPGNAENAKLNGFAVFAVDPPALDAENVPFLLMPPGDAVTVDRVVSDADADVMAGLAAIAAEAGAAMDDVLGMAPETLSWDAGGGLETAGGGSADAFASLDLMAMPAGAGENDWLVR